jgi:hypothetical protein
MPPPWQFREVRLCQGGQNSHYIAFFDWNGNAFALIPGGEATLGYDRDNPFVLNEEQREDWEQCIESYGNAKFEEVIDEVMTPLRTVTIEPFLIEVEAKEFGLIGSPNEEPTFQYIIREKGKSIRHAYFTRRQTLQLISQDGFRFPTSDEWEYACAAGTRTLWHWGNEYPLHCYPNECKDWDLNIKPNAFGLYIATDTYGWEFCAEPEIMRGGDGGGARCGGDGPIVWFCLASAFVPWEPNSDTEEHDRVHLRRVYSIPPGTD